MTLIGKLYNICWLQKASVEVEYLRVEIIILRFHRVMKNISLV